MKNLDLRGLFAASMVLVAGLLWSACASVAGPREPLLTNPVRYASWLGSDESARQDHVDADGFHGKLYEDAFRLPLSEDWTWPLPDPGLWAISRLELNTPALAGNRVLVGHSRAAGLSVLDRFSGRFLSELPTSGPVQAPAVALADGGWLVADVYGQLQRLDEALQPVWAEPYEAGAAIYRRPVVDEDQVLVSTADDQVIAVSLEDGSYRWSHRRAVARAEQELAILGSPAPVVHEGLVFAGFSDGYVVAMKRDNGAELWAVAVGTGPFPDIQAEPVVYGGSLVAAGFGGPTLAIDLETQAIRWRVESGATASMVLSDSTIYASSSRGALIAIDPERGEQLWSWEPKDRQLGEPLRVGSSLLVGDTQGTLYAIDRYEGVERWRYRPSDGTRLSGVAAAPLVAGGQVLFVSAGGTLHSLVGAKPASWDLSEEPARRADKVFGW
ncbi:MAG: hypothetical protein CMP23_07510 [Rickettsiales bacterium]|nr:hypothetical protein [Rickettsiales bacterium]